MDQVSPETLVDVVEALAGAAAPVRAAAAKPGETSTQVTKITPGTALLHMVHTRDGARAACAVLAYGTAKDRRRVVKAMRGATLDCNLITSYSSL